MATGDGETRARLLSAAADLFAARGFKDVTIREICAAAGANVAAVNYHFGDKVGLYSHVVSKAIDTMRATTDAARAAGLGRRGDERLRAYIRVFLRRVGGDGPDSWIHRLMAREIADPTPALDRIADAVLAPRIDYLCDVIAEITGRAPEEAVVRRCALSVQAQCHAAMPHPLASRTLGETVDSSEIQKLADHIADFPLAGIRAVDDRAGQADRHAERGAHVRKIGRGTRA
jgi:AcrR family transcriptional regulator